MRHTFECRIRNTGTGHEHGGRFWNEDGGKERLGGHLWGALHGGSDEIEVVCIPHEDGVEGSAVVVMGWDEIRDDLMSAPRVLHSGHGGMSLGFLLPPVPDELPEKERSWAMYLRRSNFLSETEEALIMEGIALARARLAVLAETCFERGRRLREWVERGALAKEALPGGARETRQRI